MFLEGEMFTIVYNFNPWHTKEHRSGGKRLFQIRTWEGVNWDLERNPRDRNLMQWDELLPVLASVVDDMERWPKKKCGWRVFRYDYGQKPQVIPRHQVMQSLKKWLVKEKKLKLGDAKILGFTIPKTPAGHT
jgi:hypothetical protein